MNDMHVVPLLVPLSVLGLELDERPDRLAARLGDDVLIDDLGRPAVERHIARELIASHHAEQLHRRDREQARHADDERRRSAMTAQTSQLRAHVQAVQRHQQQQRDAGLFDADVSAFARMLGTEHAERLEAAGARFDEMKRLNNSGDVVGSYHSLRKEP